MSEEYISRPLRRLVIERAQGCCEYCRMHMDDDLTAFAIDHIVSIKHGGTTQEDNLCLSCFPCNSFKGTDIASADPISGAATFFFHPRQQKWHEHFKLDGAAIVPLAAEGRVTTRILQLNEIERLSNRQLLVEAGIYPRCP